jgi:hypothetical protein
MPGNVCCQRSVGAEEFWELGRSRRGEWSLGGGFGRLGRRRWQDVVLPPGQGHHGGEQQTGARSGRIDRDRVTMGAYGTASLVTRRVPAPMRRVRLLESALAV